MLASAVQQSESAICIHVPSPCVFLPPTRTPLIAEHWLSSLCDTAASHHLFYTRQHELYALKGEVLRHAIYTSIKLLFNI